MKREKISRKQFLTEASQWGLATVVAGSWLSACSSPSEQNEQTSESGDLSPAEQSNAAPEEPAAPGDATAECNDLSGLTEVDIQQREQLQYVVQSEKDGQICSNCQFWQPEAQEDPCGGCQLFKGPINPNGWCQTWAPQQT